MDAFFEPEEGKIFEGELTEKKSRFIARLKAVHSMQEAEDFIAAEKKKYYDARHNCSAYMLAEEGAFRFSDDGEPSGTAGKPILEALEGSGIKNAVIVVTRYFGGVLLGTGPLSRAYRNAAKAAADAAVLIEKRKMQRCTIDCPYAGESKVRRIAAKYGCCIEAVDYSGTGVRFLAAVPPEGLSPLRRSLTDTLSGEVIFEEKEAAYL